MFGWWRVGKEMMGGFARGSAGAREGAFLDAEARQDTVQGLGYDTETKIRYRD